MMSDMGLLEEVLSQIAGYNLVIDLKNITASHLCSPAFAKKMIRVFLDGYPIRAKGILIINPPSLIDAVLGLIKPFLTDKLRNRVQVISNIEDLDKLIPKHLLPNEYGGTAGTTKEIAEYFKEKTIRHRDWFKEFEKYKVDEKKRPGKSKTYEEFFGVEGSFKKLNFD